MENHLDQRQFLVAIPNDALYIQVMALIKVLSVAAMHLGLLISL